jgi:hypothetical protein
MVKAALPESQSKGVYKPTTAKGELKSRFGMSRPWTSKDLEKMVELCSESTIPACRATHSLVGFTDERDT